MYNIRCTHCIIRSSSSIWTVTIVAFSFTTVPTPQCLPTVSNRKSARVVLVFSSVQTVPLNRNPTKFTAPTRDCNPRIPAPFSIPKSRDFLSDLRTTHIGTSATSVRCWRWSMASGRTPLLGDLTTNCDRKYPAPGSSCPNLDNRDPPPGHNPNRGL